MVKVGLKEAKEVGKVKAKGITKVALREVTKEKEKGGNQGLRDIREYVIIVGKRVIRQMNVGLCMGLKIGNGRSKRFLKKEKR